jgi:hypothetical protein
MSTAPIRITLASAFAAVVATVLGIAIEFGRQDPGTVLTGAGFGMSFALPGALFAMPFGLLLALLRSRMKRPHFLLAATAAGAVSGALFGLWVAGDGRFFARSIVLAMGCTWTIAALGIAALSSRSPNTSLERTRRSAEPSGRAGG